MPFAESLPIPHSAAGDALAGGAAVLALSYFALKTRVSHHAQKAAERQNRGVISPVIYVPIGHRGIAERLHNPVYEEDGTPKILMPGRNWIPRSSAVIISTQDNRYRIIHKGIQNKHEGQLYAETTVGWHVGEDAWQLFRSHYNFKSEKSLALNGPAGEKINMMPLDLAAIGIIASGLRKVLQQTKKPFDIPDSSVKTSMNRRISEKLDRVCGSV